MENTPIDPADCARLLRRATEDGDLDLQAALWRIAETDAAVEAALTAACEAMYAEEMDRVQGREGTANPN